MSSETFTTAIFLITAIVAAAILVNAFFPVIYSATSTFTESSQSTDERLRTDVKIVNAYAESDGDAKIWIKNIGSLRIADSDISSSDVYFGIPGGFDYMVYTTGTTPSSGQWTFSIREDAGTPNEYWDSGETVEITLTGNSSALSTGEYTYFQFVLPNGVSVSTQYTVS
ncbi:flagellin [Methanogenium organophilum]|uniref:Flagellin n=1 Tax=Methanogenium organophilum TaxID=2199 RepID=A0A9X9T7T9_METOG|nr:flagellin [Methanogenium organophilum]WAI01045.1 flagellin [Methanogenium organophilum]